MRRFGLDLGLNLSETTEDAMLDSAKMWKHAARRHFIGGSDARIIMGTDEAALLRLWREKRGEAEPEDLSGNLVVQLGIVTEGLNRLWFEHNTGQVVTAVKKFVEANPQGQKCDTAAANTTTEKK